MVNKKEKIKRLFEEIPLYYLMTSQPMIDAYIEHIKESVVPYESEDDEKEKEQMVEDFNKKYSSTLNEGEIDALKEISNSENREETFEKYKKACMDRLSEAKQNFMNENNSAATEKIESIMEQVSEKKFSVDTVGNDICGMIKLSNIF